MGYKRRRENRAGKGGDGGGGCGAGDAGADDEATQPTPLRLPLARLPTSTTSGDPAPLSTSRLPLHPPADQDAVSSSAGTSSGYGGSGGGSAAPATVRLLLSPPPTSPSRHPSAFPSSPPPRSRPRTAGRDTDEGFNNGDSRAEENDEVLISLTGADENICLDYSYAMQWLENTDVLGVRADNSSSIVEFISVLLTVGSGTAENGLISQQCGICFDKDFMFSYLGLLGRQDRQAEVNPLMKCVEFSINRFYQLESEEAYFLNAEEYFLSALYEPLWELFRGHSNNIIQEKLKVLSKQYGIFRRRTGSEGSSPGRAFVVSYLGILGHRQAVVLTYSKIEQKEIDAVLANVLIMSIRKGYFQFISVMEQALRPVNLELFTDEFSLPHLIERPMVQTVPDTCAIVSTTKCVESQHRKRYEARHGVGTFSCTAAAPRKLRKACRRNMIWSPKTGAYVVDVLKMIKKLGGVRTTNAPPPAPAFLQVHSWEVHRWDSGLGLSADRVVYLLETLGPVVGTIWVSPWYYLFDSSKDNVKVYKSGCARSSVHQLMSMDMFGELAGMHSVVCFQYRRSEDDDDDLHVLVLDSHDSTGPQRWIHYTELEEIQTIRVRALPRFH